MDTLYQLEQAFGLYEVDRPDLFPEWRIDLPELTLAEQERLDLSQYIRSQEFVLENPHDLDRVLQVLKQLAAIAAS